MKLAASVMVRNEAGRYLEEAISALTEFCDEVMALDDYSEDDSPEILASLGVNVLRTEAPSFYEHEGRVRQQLLEWTFQAEPTHVLAIDADEFVADGQAVRAACAHEGTWTGTAVWTLEMEEVWELDGDCLCVREDGGWRSHPVPVLYAVPRQLDETWRINDLPLACGREPRAVRQAAPAARSTGTELLHFGWTNEAERVARHQRYVVADGGRFHNSSHLDSILYRPEQIQLRGREWPLGLAPYRAALTAKVNHDPATLPR
jgi:glycosyltransferase involved in cell wall biosynthesis